MQALEDIVAEDNQTHTAHTTHHHTPAPGSPHMQPAQNIHPELAAVLQGMTTLQQTQAQMLRYLAEKDARPKIAAPVNSKEKEAPLLLTFYMKSGAI